MKDSWAVLRKLKLEWNAATQLLDSTNHLEWIKPFQCSPHSILIVYSQNQILDPYIRLSWAKDTWNHHLEIQNGVCGLLIRPTEAVHGREKIVLCRTWSSFWGSFKTLKQPQNLRIISYNTAFHLTARYIFWPCLQYSAQQTHFKTKQNKHMHIIFSLGEKAEGKKSHMVCQSHCLIWFWKIVTYKYEEGCRKTWREH